MRSLIWKEWSEQRWKAALGAVVVVGFTAVGLRTRLLRDAEIMRLSGALAALLLPLLVGAGVIAGERAEGSLATLLALPLRPGRVLLVKLLVAAAACLLPIAGAAIVACIMAGGREMAPAGVWRLHALAAAAALMMLLWVVALGAGQPHEARAAVLGAAFLALGLTPLLLTDTGFPLPFAALRPACRALLSAHPAGWLFAPGGRAALPARGLIATQLVEAGALLAVTAASLRRPGGPRG